MSGYGQFCSVARAHDVPGVRWILLVVRELLCGSSRFRCNCTQNPPSDFSSTAPSLALPERAVWLKAAYEMECSANLFHGRYYSGLWHVNSTSRPSGSRR
jgi:hypothetical protein